MTAQAAMRRILPRSLATIIALSAATALASSSPGAPTIIQLEPYLGDHWGFRAKINGHEGLFMMDTGGGLTALAPEMAAQAGCKPWGQLTGFRMRGDRLDLKRCDNVAIDIGDLTLHLPTTGIWDFNKMLPKDAAPLAANVGLDAFAGHVLTLDIHNRQLIIETPKSLRARIAAAKQVPVQFIKEVEGYSITFAVALDLPKGRVWMSLDSGDDAAITIGTHLAAEMGLDPEKKGAQPLDTALSGGVPLHGSAYVKDIIFDGNIGAPIISSWVVTIDLVDQRVWIAPASPKP
jgi:hypothetical protein